MRAFIISFFLAGILFSAAHSQSALIKKINVTVTDAVSTRPIEGAEVTYKGLFKKQTKTTGENGIATFDILFLGSSPNATLEINDGSIVSGHKKQIIPVTLTQEKNIYDYSVAMKSDYKRLIVSVREQAPPEAIPNATVRLEGTREANGESLQTDAGGTASFDILLIDKVKTIPVTISKQGYSEFKTTVELNQKTDQYRVNALLKKEKYSKILRVTVLNQKDGSPIPGATITADQSFLDIFTGETVQNGQADLVFTTGGTFKVTVKAGNFEPAERTVEIKRFGDKDLYEETFRLTKKEFNRDVHVTVLEEYEPGKTRKKNEALVKLDNGMNAVTGLDGKVVLRHNRTMGDMVNITASGKNDEPATQTIIVGGSNWRYYPPQFDEVTMTLKYKPSIVHLKVHVVDEQSAISVGTAKVVARSSSGEYFPDGYSNNLSEFNFDVSRASVGNYIRLTVTATGYEEKWTDVTPDLLQSNDRLFTVYLEKKKAPKDSQEKEYGPYTITLDGWKDTQLKLRKGGSFRVKVSGTIMATEDGKSFEILPDGTGHWGWFVLAAKIGEKFMEVGSNRGATSDEGGMLELGAPRGNGKFYEVDAKDKTGSWSVYVYSKDATEVSRVSGNVEVNSNNSLFESQNLKEAKQGVSFFRLLLNDNATQNRDIEEIMIGVQHLMEQFGLDYYGSGVEYCTGSIKNYITITYKHGTPTTQERSDFSACINLLLNTLQNKINNKQIQ